MKLTHLFILVLILKQILWIAFVPIWQFPDEQAHFAQVQNIAESTSINPANGLNTSKEIDISEQLLGTKRDWLGNNKYTYHPEFNLDYTRTLSGKYELILNQLPIAYRWEKVSTEATAYPPLYYQMASLGYRMVYSYDIITRVFVTRLINLFLFLPLIYFVYAIGRLLFPQSILFSWTLATLIGFHPMLSFVYSGINSDNLYNLLFTIGIYLGILILKKRISLALIALSLLLIILISYTKPQGKLIFLVFFAPILYQLWKLNKRILTAIFIVLSLQIINPNVRNYILNTRLIEDLPVISKLDGFTINSYIIFQIDTLKKLYRETLPWYWGVFRWLSLTYPRIIHRSINWSLVLAGIGYLIIVVKKSVRERKIISTIYFVYIIYVVVAYTLSITTYDYLFTLWHGFSLGIQGRYFFPTIVIHLVILLLGWYFLIPQKFKVNGLKFINCAIICLHLYAILFVVSSYYNLKNVNLVFIHASQYKPVFFKSPILEIITLAFLIISITHTFKFLRQRYEQN